MWCDDGATILISGTKDKGDGGRTANEGRCVPLQYSYAWLPVATWVITKLFIWIILLFLSLYMSVYTATIT